MSKISELVEKAQQDPEFQKAEFHINEFIKLLNIIKERYPSPNKNLDWGVSSFVKENEYLKLDLYLNGNLDDENF